ncbi:hypothetical protein QBC41DRAFT_349798 [Cercophora samala]|uniref:Uncharacterized protein n=1 Tax=Cercophora samala TaxID=330535 RepID=A0AA39Z6Q2_9PEZI|nr:hypothetical protein QBC41DRAFT_349798 [Cercophora samala]
MSGPPRETPFLRGGETVLPDKPASSTSFTYGAESGTWPNGHSCFHDIFRKDGVAFLSDNALKELLLTPHSGLHEPVRPKITKHFLSTQLEFYGLKFKKSDRLDSLRKTLENALKTGKCKDLDPSMSSIRDRLRADYDEAFEQLYDRLFAELKNNVVQEANIFPVRFVKKYFLNIHGKPDRTKTKEALTFRIWNQDIKKELTEAVQTIPGLILHPTYAVAFLGWENTIEDGIKKEFSRLETFYEGKKQEIHTAQANIDVALLLRQRLFIGVDGAFVPGMQDKKSSSPVILDRWKLEDRKLPESIISKNPGLKMREFNRWVVVIGLESDQVDFEINALTEAAERQKELEEAKKQQEQIEWEAAEQAKWNRRIAGYHQLLSAFRQHEHESCRGMLDLSKLPGKYVVKATSKELAEYDAGTENEEEMILNIFPTPSSTHGVKASFHFGLIEGTMLLGMSRRNVEMLREEQPKHSDYSDRGDSDEEDDAIGSGYFHSRGRRLDDDGSTVGLSISSNWSTGLGNNSKVKLEDAKENKPPVSSPMVGQKRDVGNISDPWGVQAARAKRQQMMASTSSTKDEAQPIVKKEPESPRGNALFPRHLPPKSQHPNRVYFQFVYNDVGGYPDVDDGNKHIGHFDFDKEAGWLKATGMFHLPNLYCDKAQTISIWKISDVPSKREPKEWYEFDGRRWGSRW